MHLAFNLLVFLTYQASDFNNWEKWEILLCFIILNGRFSFKLNFILGWNSTRFIRGWNSRVNRNFYIPGWDFILVTCKRTLNNGYCTIIPYPTVEVKHTWQVLTICWRSYPCHPCFWTCLSNTNTYCYWRFV